MFLYGLIIVLIILIIKHSIQKCSKRSHFSGSTNRSKIKKLFNYNDQKRFYSMLSSPITTQQFAEVCQIADNNPWLTDLINVKYYCPASCYDDFVEWNSLASNLSQKMYSGIQKTDPELLRIRELSSEILSKCSPEMSFVNTFKTTQIYKDLVAPPLDCINSFNLNAFEGLNPTSIGANYDRLRDFCQTGSDIIDKCNEQGQKYLDNQTFRTVCCNESGSICGVDQLDLAVKSSDLLNTEYSLQNFNDSSITGNLRMLKKYCTDAAELLKNRFTKIFDARNSSIYKKYCNPGLETAGRFITDDYSLQNFNPSAIAANIDALSAYCEDGDFLLNNNYRQIVDPSNSAVYQKYCVQTGGRDGLLKAANFINKDYSLQNFNTNAITSNLPLLQGYCDDAKFLVQNDYTSIIDPRNSAVYKKFCNPGLERSGQFITKDYDLQNFNDQSITANLETLLDYCDDGQFLVENNYLDIVDPQDSAVYQKYCVPSSDALAPSGRFMTRDYALQNFNPYAITANLGTLRNYCADGRFLAQNNYNKIIDPTKSATYNKYCNPGLETSGRFITRDYSLQNFNPSSISANIDTLKAYCSDGDYLVQNGYTEIVDPQDSATYKKYCNPGLEASGRFMNRDYSLQNFNPNSITANIGILKSYCADGDFLTQNGLTSIVDPSESSIYTKYCNPGLEQAGRFINSDYSMQNFNTGAITANLPFLNSYCADGKFLTNNRLIGIVDPNTSSPFNKYCQGGLEEAGRFINWDYSLQNFNTGAITPNLQTLKNYCADGDYLVENGFTNIVNPSDSSVYNKFCKGGLEQAGRFITKDYDFQNLNPYSLQANSDAITAWCNDGKYLVNNNLFSIVDPRKSANYNKYCTPCFSDSAKFINQDYSLQNFNPSAASANRATLIDYCTTGSRLVSNGCNTLIDPQNSSAYRGICCVNGTCDPAAGCYINNSDFGNMSYNLQNFNDNSISSNIDYLAKYCSTGNDLIANGCRPQGITDTPYRKYCCDGTTCTPAVFQNCTVNSGRFLNMDYSMRHLNPSSLVSNADAVRAYCGAGFSINNNCINSVAKPGYSPAFQNLCCTEANGCNEAAMNCKISLSDFNNRAYNLQTLVTNIPSVQFNLGQVIPFCTLGKNLINNCGIDVSGNYTYRGICGPYI